MKKISSILSICFALCLALAISAFGAQAEAAGAVYDNAKLLNQAEKERLTQKIQQIEQKYGVRIGVVTQPTLQGRPVGQVANALLDSGYRGAQNGGIVLLLSMQERDFISAEISLGLSTPRILFLHIFPNIMKQMFVYMGNNASSVTLQYAGLAFIGLGTDVTNPDWGTLLYSYRMYMLTYPRLVVIPIIAVCLLALFFHFAFDDGSAGKEELTIYD